MPKPRRRSRQNGDASTFWHERPRHEAQLPREQLAQQPFVWDGRDRLIAPWPRNAEAMGDPAKRRLLCCLDYVRAARPNCPLWIWPERTKPELVQNPDPVWLARWSEGRAVYVVTRAVCQRLTNPAEF